MQLASLLKAAVVMSKTPVGQLDDATNNAVSCSSHSALEWFNKGILAYITLNGSPMACFDKALEHDPEFLIVHCLLVSANSFLAISCNGSKNVARSDKAQPNTLCACIKEHNLE